MSPFLPNRIACAAGILRRGQEAGEAAYREYARARRRIHDAKDRGPSGCVPACARGVVSLDRCSASVFAPRLADRIARTQRRLFLLGRNGL